jgi:Secretion system C-terminal sorting domain
MKKRALIFFLLVGIVLASKAQNSNLIYGLDNTASGQFYFASIDKNTGVFTDYSLLPFTSYTSGSSSCADIHTGVYYFSNFDKILGIDANTGTLVTNVTMPIPSTAEFLHMSFNPCDTTIYGFVNDPPSSIAFAHYDPRDTTMTILFQLPTNSTFCGGCMSYIKSNTNEYVVHFPGTLTSFDMTTGQINYATPIVNLPNEIFGHIAYDCKSDIIVGTSGNSQTGLKYLANLDPVTGQVTHISQSGWSTGFWKPMSGGDCMDQNNNIYYYSGAPNLVVGANTNIGDTVFARATGSGGPFMFIQHFSQCPCSFVGITETETVIELTVFPNPAADYFTLTISELSLTANYQLALYDLLGQNVINQPIRQSQTRISTQDLAPGVYLYELIDLETGKKSVGKIQKGQ